MGKNFFLSCLTVFVLLSSLHAQQNYFAFIQADDKQPFYIKVNSKLLNSSPTGYIIVPKLQTGTYPVEVGFPQDKYPVQNLRIDIKGTDVGYQLKNLGNKGWGFYNYDTKELIVPTAAASTPVQQVIEVKKDTVTQPLVSPIAKSEQPKASALNTTPQPQQPTTQTTIPSADVVAPQKENVVQNAVPEKVTSIDSKTTFTTNNFETKEYYVSTEKGTDTVVTYIPVDELARPSASNTQIIDTTAPPSTPVKDKPFDMVKKKINQVLKKGGDTTTPKPAEPTQSSAPADTVTDNAPKPLDGIITKINQVFLKKDASSSDSTRTPITISNIACTHVYNDDDLYQLRKKIALEKDENDMILEARKAFTNTKKCITTAQVKYISALFMTEKGKYDFFDATYAYTADPENFSSLSTELQDPYYAKRFKAMLKN